MKDYIVKMCGVISILSCSESCWHCLEIKSAFGIFDHYYFSVVFLKADCNERLLD